MTAGNSVAIGPFRLGRSSLDELLFAAANTNANPLYRAAFYVSTELSQVHTIDSIRADLNRSGGVFADYNNFSFSVQEVPFEYIDDDTGNRVFVNSTRNMYDYPLGTTLQAMPFVLTSGDGRTNVYEHIIVPTMVVEGFRMVVGAIIGSATKYHQLTGLVGTWRYLGQAILIAPGLTYAEIFPVGTPTSFNEPTSGPFVRIA